MRKVRKNVLVAGGNQPLYAADQPVYDESGVPLAEVGQIVIYDPVTLQSLGVGITPKTNDRIVLGVVYLENGIKVLRKSFGDYLFTHNINAWNVTPPACGQSQIKNFFAKCLECDEDYSLEIGVLNDRIETQFATNRMAKYPFTVPVNCCYCNNCDTPEVDADEVFRRIVRKINGEIDGNQPRTAFFNQPLSRLVEKSFYAIQLFKGDGTQPTVVEYCINPVKNVCGSCINAEESVGSITYTDADGNAQTIEFTTTTSTEGTPLGNFGFIADKINTALGYTAATITQGTGACCASKLIVSLDPATVTDFQILDTDDAAIAECDSYNPFTEIDSEFNGGVMIISKPTPLNLTKCYGPNPPTSNPVAEIQIFPKGGFHCGATKVVNQQELSYPRGLGYYLAWEEYASDNGGTGRNHEPYNRQFGPLGLPHANDRANSASSDPNGFYCEYVIEHSLPATSISVMDKEFTNARGTTLIAIESMSDVTRAEFEAIMNPYMEAVANVTLEAITCDEDAAENWDLPNGRIE